MFFFCCACRVVQVMCCESLDIIENMLFINKAKTFILIGIKLSLFLKLKPVNYASFKLLLQNSQ